MTRDNAIEILSRIWGGNPQHGLANSYADAFVALGMLKLDEPPTLDERINTALNTEMFSARDKCAGNIKTALDKAGFKIIEK